MAVKLLAVRPGQELWGSGLGPNAKGFVRTFDGDSDPVHVQATLARGYWEAPITKAEPKDGDNDGFIYDGTPRQRPATPKVKPARIKRGKRAGMHAATEEDHAWMKERWGIKVPPAWTDVQVTDDRDAALVVVGIDSKGRSQYVYNRDHMEAQAVKKFDRVQALRDELPKLDEALAQDADTDPAAAAVLLMRHLGLRPGSDADTGAEKKAFGATNMEVRHVSVSGKTVTFEFVGKKGVDIKITSDNPEVVAIVKKYMKGKEPGDKLFGTNQAKANAYLKSKIGDFKVKDLRTQVGTYYAYSLVAAMDPQPSTPAEIKKAIKEVAEKVSDLLGNTPSVALTSYINPIVFAPWR